jgi:exosortase/archaeosortase
MRTTGGILALIVGVLIVVAIAYGAFRIVRRAIRLVRDRRASHV